MYFKKYSLKYAIILLIMICATISCKTQTEEPISQLKQIFVTQQPDITNFYRGESLDLSGLRIAAVYSDGKIEDVKDFETFPKDGSLIENENSLDVTITYKGKNCSIKLNVTDCYFDIPVINKQPQSVNGLIDSDLQISIEVLEPEDGSLIYQWYVSSDKKTYKEIEGNNVSVLTVNEESRSKKYYYCKVIHTVGVEDDLRGNAIVNPAYKKSVSVNSDVVEVEFLEPMKDVTNFSILQDNNNNLILSWNDTDSDSVDYYELTWNQDSSISLARAAIPMQKKSVHIPQGQQAYIINNYIDNMEYVFTLKTIDLDGRESEGITTRITTGNIYNFPISDLLVSRDESAIIIQWNNPEEENFSGTKIFITDNSVSSSYFIDSTHNSFRFDKGTHGEHYSIILCAVNKEGIQSSTVETEADYYVYNSFSCPVIAIETPNNMEIRTKEWLSDKGLENAKMSIYNAPNSDLNVSEIDIDIKGRGNSSWSLPKKPYSIKLGKKDNLLNIANGKHKNYALIANHADKSLIRNQLVYYLGENVFSAMGWAPHTAQVNLFINGKYRGVYLLTERIKINKEIVNIQDISDMDESSPDYNFADGGWILERNNRLDELYNFTTSHNIAFSLKEPDDYVGWKKIRDYIEEFESVLWDDQFFKDPENGWRKYLDEDSFIDWYIVNAFVHNADMNFSSVYMYYNPKYKKIFMGPLWDFDRSFGNSDNPTVHSTSTLLVKTEFYQQRLFLDDLFVDKLKTRWNECYGDLCSALSLDGVLGSFEENVRKDAELNFKVWQILGTYVAPMVKGELDRKTYQSELDFLNNWISERLINCNNEINSL